MENPPLLVRTPPPYHYESLFGFLLRVSELNGYQSPWDVAKLAGMSVNESKSRKLPVGKLTQVLGLDANALNRFSYLPFNEGAGNRFKLLDHDLGHMYSVYQVRRGCQFCPLCVKEDGYIDAFWDLSSALACPRHSVLPLSYCHQCHEEIKWFRRGLLRCKCGANLLDAPLKKANQVLVGLMEIIYAKVHDTADFNQANHSSFPLDDLRDLKLTQLLPIIYKMGALSRLSLDPWNSFNEGYAGRGIKAACNIFSDWPNGFHGLVKLNRKNSHAPNTDFWAEFKDFYKELMTDDLLDRGYNFLLAEFILFGMVQCPACAEVTLKTIPIEAFLKTKQYVFRLATSDLPSADVQKSIKQKSLFTEKRAAKYLGMPLKVFTLLSQSSALIKFVIFHIDKTLEYPWHECELEGILQATCISSSKRGDVRPIPIGELVSFKDIMSMEMATNEIKASFVLDVLWGNFSVYGWGGGNMAGLLFERRSVTKYIVKRRPGYESACLSLSEAAAKLGASKELVQALMHLGLISHVLRRDTQYVLLYSLSEFERKFITPVTLSKKLNLSVETLQSTLEILRVPTLQFPIDAGGIQEIMDRRFESKIETYLNSALTPPSDASSPSAPLDKFPKKQLGEFRKRGVHSELKHAPQTWATL